jgi:Zn-dependent protease with chaperone function
MAEPVVFTKTNHPHGRVRLPGLPADAFRHPLDLQATANLRRVPGFDRVIATLIEWGVERVEYVNHTASGVRVGPTQLPRVHRLLREACAILDIPEPELYVRQGDVNAYTSGHNNPYIVLYTGLIDLLTEDELLGVIAHEAGHIKCGHVLYKTMARVFGGAATSAIPRTSPASLIIGTGVRLALRTWDRASEFTADRAAMLVTQDLETCVGMMMKLAGGVRSDTMDPAAFLEQARHLDDLAEQSRISRLARFQMRMTSTHPLVVDRARRFDQWITSGQPSLIINRYGGIPRQALPSG